VANDVTVRLGDVGMRTDTDIAQALTRSVEIDARRINVAVTDSKVILSGNVHSCLSAPRLGAREPVAARHQPRCATSSTSRSA